MQKLFGTDGIRARAGQFPLDSLTLPAIGQAIGEQFSGTILVGQDPRTSSPWIFDLLKDGIETGGGSIENTGVLPTPAIALLTQRSSCGGGVMISASHNPFEDNGIKIFGANGQKLNQAEEDGIETRIHELVRSESGRGEESRPGIGNSAPPEPGPPAWSDRYQKLLLERFAEGRWLEGVSLVADCANGAMSWLAPALLRSLGAIVVEIASNPSGNNINAMCGAVHPEALMAAVGEHGADLGVAFDGDGDRSLFADANGRLIDGDAVLLLLARRMKAMGTLDPSTVIGTSMTNYNLERMLGSEGVRLVRVDVGDRHVFEAMRTSGSTLGGEPSGHIILSDFGLSGDGLLTTLKVCETIVSSGTSLGELTRDWEAAPQLLRNVTVKERVPLETLPAVGRKIEELTEVLAGCGRVVIRYSGTEPLLRVMIESDSHQKNETYADEFISVFRSALD